MAFGGSGQSPVIDARPEPAVHRRTLAVGLVLSTSLVAFEVTSVLTALPTISEELDGDSLYGATLAAYMLAKREREKAQAWRPEPMATVPLSGITCKSPMTGSL